MKKVPDPRSSRKKKHDCAEILTCIVIGYLVGRTSLRRTRQWALNHIDYLKQHMKLENGIPSVATMHRLLRDIDQAEFNNVFMQWVRQIVGNQEFILAIDGKGLRGAADKISDGRTPYILNVMDVKNKLVIAQYPIDEKANEISEIPKLLGLLDLEGNIITIDAIGTQWKIMDIISRNGGFYLLTVKANQSGLLDEIKEDFRYKKNEIEQYGNEKCDERYECHQSQEKNRSRIEYRQMEVLQGVSIAGRTEPAFDDIQTIGLHEQVRIPMKRDKDGNDITPDYETFRKQAIERRIEKAKKESKYEDEYLYEGMISNKIMGAEEMAEVKRNHWCIENCLHHVLDDLFREDRSSATVTKDNLALIRKFDFNLLQIAIHFEHQEYGPTQMSDTFADDPSLITKYIFSKIPGYI